MQDAVVLTPSPRHHALYADKRHLVRLADEAWLQRIGVPAAARRVLAAHVPKARLVAATDAEQLWSERKRYFFKPFAGYASRGAYRGDRLTKRVWSEIIASGNYIAPVSYTHLRAHETVLDLVCRLLLEKQKK
mgnify:CR=1 FL=1